MKFQDILKRFDEEDNVKYQLSNELQIEDFTKLMVEGLGSIFFLVLVYHYVSIIICNIIREYYKLYSDHKKFILSSSYFLHVC